MVPTSLCCPSRATILSGRYAHSTGVWGNHYPLGGWRRVREQGVEDESIATALDAQRLRDGPDRQVLQRLLRAAPAGYVPPGWDHFWAFRTPGRSGCLLRLPALRARRASTATGPYSTDVLARRADRLIRSTAQETPLFLYLATWAPHGPFTPPRRYAATPGTQPAARGRVEVADRRRLQPAWLRAQRPVSAAAMEAVRDGQDRSLLAVDDAVDRVVRALRESGRLHNTLFLFMSDNGLLRGEHGLTGKHVPYDAATRVPMVLRWDARVPAGTVDRRLALNVDVAATLSAAAGVPMTTEGLDLLGPADPAGLPGRGDRQAQPRPAGLLRLAHRALPLRPLRRPRGGALRLRGRPVRGGQPRRRPDVRPDAARPAPPRPGGLLPHAARLQLDRAPGRAPHRSQDRRSACPGEPPHGAPRHRAPLPGAAARVPRRSRRTTRAAPGRTGPGPASPGPRSAGTARPAARAGCGGRPRPGCGRSSASRRRAGWGWWPGG